MLRYLLFSVQLFVCFSFAVTPPGEDASLKSLQPAGQEQQQASDLLQLELAQTIYIKKRKDATAEAMVEGNVMAKDNDKFHHELQTLIDKESHTGKTLSVGDIQSLVGKEVVLSVKDVHAAVEQVRGDLIGQLKEGINELAKGTSFIKSHEKVPEMADKMKLLEDNIAELKEKVQKDQSEEPMMVPAKSSSVNSGNVNQTVVVIVGNENATAGGTPKVVVGTGKGKDTATDAAATADNANADNSNPGDNSNADNSGDSSNNSGGGDGVKLKPAGVEEKNNKPDGNQYHSADGGSLEESTETISNDADADDDEGTTTEHHHRHRHHVKRELN